MPTRSQLATLGERNPPLGSIANDDVIVEAKVEQPGSLCQLPRQAEVLRGRRRIARGMVVHENQGGCTLSDGGSQDFTRMDEGCGLCADRDLCVQQVLVLGVEQNRPE